MTIIAAADGSALGNPGPAGWAWYIDDARWRCGGWKRGTNNQGELTAVLDLLRQTAHTDEPLHVLCDSQYVINSITKWMAGWKRKGWKKADGKPVLNVEVMKALDAAIQGRNVTFEWVKGHAGHEMNEKADELANSAAKAHAAKKLPDAGPGFPGATAVGAGEDPAAPRPRGKTTPRGRRRQRRPPSPPPPMSRTCSRWTDWPPAPAPARGPDRSPRANPIPAQMPGPARALLLQVPPLTPTSSPRSSPSSGPFSTTPYDSTASSSPACWTCGGDRWMRRAGRGPGARSARPGGPIRE
ncbi:ribonuclease H [Dietzia aerolata]|uniref:ribonuclease H family protein n=1 Tax=Dietzia aerolata TaxID=595984 RepID=UPI0036414FCB